VPYKTQYKQPNMKVMSIIPSLLKQLDKMFINVFKMRLMCTSDHVSESHVLKKYH